MAAGAAPRLLPAAALWLLAVKACVVSALRTADLAAGTALGHPKEPKEHHQHGHHKHEAPAAASPPPAQGAKDANGACRAPEPGDKVVYFVRHGQKDMGADPVLSKLGRFQANILKMQPALAAALSANASHRAQLLLISPLRRTMETAVLGFGGQLPPEQWLLSADVMEQEIRDQPQVEKGEAMLQGMGFSQLLEQYRRLSGDSDSATRGGTTNRDDNRAQSEHFAELLLRRPEERFIVVSHHWFAENVAGHNLNEGQVGISALTPAGQWRRLDMPGCWPQFREQYAEQALRDNSMTSYMVPKKTMEVKDKG